MRHSYSFSLIMLPLVMLLALAITLFVQRAGVTYSVNSTYYTSQQFLPSEILEIKNYFPDEPASALVVYDSGAEYKEMKDLTENMYAILDTLRVKYDVYDVRSGDEFDFENYEVVVFGVLDTTDLDAKTFEIVQWVDSGGRIFFAIRPDKSSLFDNLLISSGVATTSENLVFRSGILFLTDLLPGARDKTIGSDFIWGSGYPVEIDNEECTVHVVSADDNKTPLVWACNAGKGRVVVINSDQFGAKVSRGLVAAAYTLSYDAFVYPVINSSTLYIDDFPAPFPEGSNELITKFYDMDTEDFFRNIWWADMQEIAEKYNIRYTVGMIETYDGNIVPPLPKQLELENHKYFGGAILAMNGEIIYHGYNHVPLCTAEHEINELNGYPAWPNTESAQLSLVEIYNFGNSVFSDYNILGYMPPSNILCSDSRRWLPIVVPDLKYIASIYLPDLDEEEYEQEFSEASDGVIEYPRIISGYDLIDDQYSIWAAMNELGLHYVSSHFVHPDDLLDTDRHAEKGWDDLKGQYEAFIAWLQDSAPGLRNMTGSEGAMAVQRYSRLALSTTETDKSLEITLGNFYDEAWLMVRTARKPLSVEGGQITQVSSDRYLIQALEPELTVLFEE